MVSCSEEALRVFWKSWVTSTIPMVRFYVAAVEIISRSVRAVRTVKEEWSK